jgi:hypothetical protein
MGLEAFRAGPRSITGMHNSGRRWHRCIPDFITFTDRARPAVSGHQPDRGLTMKKQLPVAILCAFLIAGCAARGVRVAELKDQPTKYATKTVKVTGVVTSSWGIPLVPFQLYNVDDGSGEITVLSRSGRTPARGTRVEVEGKISEFAVFGGRSVGLHIQEEDRKVKS